MASHDDDTSVLFFGNTNYPFGYQKQTIKIVEKVKKRSSGLDVEVETVVREE